MTDDFEALRAALKAAPGPDPVARAADMRLAIQNFDKMHAGRQGSIDLTRLEPDRPIEAGFLTKVRLMLKTLSCRPILTATTSAAALCLGVVLVLPLTKSSLPLPKVGSASTTLQTPVPEPMPYVLTAPAAPLKPVMEKPLPSAAKSEAPLSANELRAEPTQSLAGSAPAPQPQGAPSAGAQSQVASAPEVQAPIPPATVAKAPRPTPPTSVEADKMAAPRAAPMAAPMAAESDAVAQASPEPAQGAIANLGAAESGVYPMSAPSATLRGVASGVVMDALHAVPAPNTEAFANAAQNPVHVTAEEPVSTFSIDIDTAAFSVIRASLNAGQLPPVEAVRIEEMVNYFPYDLPQPKGDAPFEPTVTVMQTPWNPNTRLVLIALQGRQVTERPPLNLIFLIDTSGSMEDANKLPLLKQSLALMLPKLAPQDRVAIVAYAGSAGEVLAPTPASDRATILNALDNLAAGGSTAGAEGLTLAYQIAGQMAEKGRVSRVLLATDGDFNVGIDTADDLKSFIAKQRDSGTYLSVLGFGRGSLDDAAMQALAQNGNGTASYIDTLSEAQKVLGDQLTGAMFSIANDVKVQVEWNPAQVAEYRLIGYETRALRREDFNNDKVDAGDIGAGLQVTALYEVTAPGSQAILNNALRYKAAPQTSGPNELGYLRLRYKEPGQTTSRLIETPIAQMTNPNLEAQFAAAIAGFGQLLRHSDYLGDWGYDQAIALAAASKGADPYGYRAEAVTLMRLAQSLSR